MGFVAGRSALLVLDMQRYFLDGASHAFVPSGPAILPRIKELILLYLQASLPVILTRHLNTKKDAGMLGVWWSDIIEEGGGLSGLDPELIIGGTETIIKTQYDAFFGTNLEERLRERAVEQVVITGVMTHLCCETTARSAFVRGFGVLMPIDGTATYNEDFHLASLRNLSHGFADPVLCRHIVEGLEKEIALGGGGGG